MKSFIFARQLSTTVLAATSILILAAASAQPIAAGPSRPGHTKLSEAVVEVPFTWRAHMPAVEVMVNGKGPFQFALDTGAQGLARADVTLVKELDLKTTGQINVSPTRAMDLVALDSITIGGAEFSGGLQALSRDYNQMMPRDTEPIHGILGIDLFADCLLTIDYPNKRIRIEQGELPAPDGKEILPLVADSPIPTIELTVQDQNVIVHIDAGKPDGLQLPNGLADKLNLASEPVVTAQGRTVHGDFTIRQARLNGEFSIGRHRFVNPTLQFADVPIHTEQAGILGALVLKQFTITFDRANQRVRFHRDGDDIVKMNDDDAPKRHRVGIMFAQGPSSKADGGLRVEGVIPDGPAASAGLQAGDIITEINGEDTAGAAPMDFMKALSSPQPVRMKVDRDGEELEFTVQPAPA